MNGESYCGRPGLCKKLIFFMGGKKSINLRNVLRA
jgi:hypothetical protein